VFSPVGYATHYHTDWVAPNWSSEMDKLVELHSHLFFRWRGWWGQPRAFRGFYAGPEVLDPRVLKLARVGQSAEGKLDNRLEAVRNEDAPGLVPTMVNLSPPPGGNVVKVSDNALGTYLLQLDPAAYPGGYAVAAWNICKGRSPCRVLGWRNPANVPVALPLKGDWRSTLSFSFERSAANVEAAYWNCHEIMRANPTQCLP
jgi:hypothetical protein